MVQYRISYVEPHRHILHISCLFENLEGPTTRVKMPMWRPGRYELQQFPKFIQQFDVIAPDGSPIPFKKIHLNEWEIAIGTHTRMEIKMRYFTTEINAGSSYVDEGLLYINPCTCLLYQQETMLDACQLQLDIPDGFYVASVLPEVNKHIFLADSFDTLADSPIIASPDLQMASFPLENKSVRLVMWGQQHFKPADWLNDFELFCRKQVELFGDFPCPTFDFLLLFPSQKIRHGVEHSNNTVCVIGGIQDLPAETVYKDMLALASHEFFHLWNIKRIRPSSMLPYDFNGENLSTLGWVYEGFTTYYGDLMCLRSGVFSWDDYAAAVSVDLQKHMDNFGRYRYSVAESSFDTWLDGYVPGVPGRKVSIYTEGMLAALILDVWIRQTTKGIYSLDEVMRRLYTLFYKRGLGYDEDIVKAQIEDVAESSADWFFTELVWGKGYVEKRLPHALQWLGLVCERFYDTEHPWERFGLKLSNPMNGQIAIQQLHPQSPWLQYIARDWTIEAVNGISVSDGIPQTEWEQEQLTITFRKGQLTKTIQGKADSTWAWTKVRLTKHDDASVSPDAFRSWSGILP